MEYHSLQNFAFKKLRRQYFFSHMPLPLLISGSLILIIFAVSKQVFHGIFLIDFVLLGLILISLLGWLINKWFQVPFQKEDVNAWIDQKVGAGGLFMTLHEKGNAQYKWEDHLNKILVHKEDRLPRFTLSDIGLALLISLCVVAIVYLIPIAIPKIIQSGTEIAKDITDPFKEEIAALAKENLLKDENEKDDLMAFVLDLEKKTEEEGLNKSVWEARDRLKKMLEKKYLEQQNKEQKMINQLDRLSKALTKSDNIDQLSQVLDSLEKNMIDSKNSFSKKELEELSQQMKNVQQNINGLSPEEIKNIFDAMKKMGKSLKMQIMKRKSNSAMQCNKGGACAGGNKSLQEDLDGLIKSLKPREKMAGIVIVLTKGSGKGGIDRGPGAADLNHTNDTTFEGMLKLKKISSSGKVYNNDGKVEEIKIGEHDSAVLGDKSNTKRDFTNTTADSVNQDNVPPHRRKIIKKYFKR
ncbi:MAG: hypothetical protein COA79_16475 [Planctomycetota bacterium]|nr:MAG: hypothetical protein COA79_16475 [Planctomycetota bacterium]